ncbi:MAG: hypothetical protein K2I72_02145, partial [Bacilli bacterium]|nr:hypothetical protein [Bacilli bacterium]
MKLRPTSKEGIKENLSKFPEQPVQKEVATTPTEVSQEVVAPTLTPEVAPVVSETPSDVVATPDLQPPVVPSEPIAIENKTENTAISKVSGLNFYDIEGHVTTLNNQLPKGLKLKEGKAKNMIAQAPAPLFKVVARIEKPEMATEDEFQTVELKIGEDSEMSEIEVPKMNFEANVSENDEMQEIVPTAIGEVTNMGKAEDTGMEEITTSEIKKEFEISKEETKTEESEQRKAVVPIYELCEAIDIQRGKTREAELKASQLTIDFQKYKEQSQQEIDKSYLEVKEAGDSQSEAEARYQIAEQEHRSALQNLIDTGKNQQKILQERQKEADAQVRAVVQERKALEQTNNTTLAQNKVQLQKYLNHTIELNEQIQIK